MKNKNLFEIVYVTDDDIKNKYKELSNTLDEKDISEFSFNDESLYLIGRGHDFVYGFYEEYLTKSGIVARGFASGIWSINNERYKLKDGNFITDKIEYVPTNIDFSSITFPIVKNVPAKSIASQIVSVTPKEYR